MRSGSQLSHARAVLEADRALRAGAWGYVLLATVIYGLLAASAACNRLTPEQRAQQQLEVARAAVKKGKNAEAIIDYRKAIQDDSRIAATHYELGRLYVGEGDYSNGVRQLTAAIELDGSNVAARLELAEIFLLAKNFADAKAQADEVLTSRSGDPAALLVLAKSLAGMGQNKDAEIDALDVLKNEPANADAWLLLAGLQFQAKNFGQSEHSFRQAIQYDQTPVAAVAAFTVLLLQESRPAEAEQVIRKCASDNPTNVSVQSILAAFLMQEQRIPEAEAVFRNIAQLGQADPRQRAALANFYVATNRPDLAEKEYSGILEKYSGDVLNRAALASLYLNTGRSPQAEKLLNQILVGQPDYADALVLRGRLKLQQNRLDDGVADLQHATRSEPTSVLAHYYLATALMQKGQLKPAEAELRGALELQKDFAPARTLLAGIELDGGDVRESLSDLDRVVTAKPGALEPYLMQSLILADHGNAAKAERDLLPLLNEFPEAPARAATYRALAWVMISQKKFAEARDFLGRAEQAQPSSPETLRLLGLSYIEENRSDTALSILDARLKQNPRWADGDEVAGNLMYLANRSDVAERFFRSAIAIGLDTAQVWEELGDALAREQKLDEAVEACRNSVRRSPNDASAYMRLAQLQDKRGDWAAAEDAYQKVLSLEADNAQAKNNLAWDYAGHGGNIDVALRLAQEASREKPDDLEISDTLGWIYVLKNTPEYAIQVLKECVAKGPQNAEYSYHLGLAYVRAGRPSEARRYLQSSVSLEPDSAYATDARKMLVSLAN